MKGKPDIDKVNDVFWGNLKNAACQIWENDCPADDCINCVFDAPKDEFKEWLKKALGK